MTASSAQGQRAKTTAMPSADDSASVEFPMFTPATVASAAARPFSMAVSSTTAIVAPGLITRSADIVA